MTEPRRHDLDQTVIRIGGRDASVTELLKVAVLAILTVACVVVAVAWYRPVGLLAIVLGAAAVGAWVTRP